MLYILKKNKFKFEEIIFVLLPIGIISGPLISEIIINYVSIVFLYYIFKNKNFSIFDDKIIKLLFLFYLIIIISAIGSFFHSAYGHYSLIKNIFYFRFILFGMAVFWLIRRNKNVIEIFYKVLVISYVLLFLGATYEFFFKINCSGYDQNGFYIIKENYFFCSEKLLIGNIIREDRLSSFFGDELVLGSYLSRLLPLLIFLHLVHEKKKNKEFFNSFYIIILTTFFTFWSGERVSFFFCLITLIIFFIFSKPPIKLKITILSFCILLIGVFSIYNPVSKERMFKQTFSQIYNAKTNEFMFFSLQHQSHAEAALDMFKKKPILGVGPKNFRNVCFEENY